MSLSAGRLTSFGTWSGQVFRLIIDEPREAALNMALDEFLAARAAERESVLRIYFWKNPSCTVGYFQDPAKLSERFGLAQKGIAVVRRVTGGGMVFHDKDLTFSLCVGNPSPYFPRDVKESYLKVNEAVLAGLRERYPRMDFSPCKDSVSGRGGDRLCFDNPSCYDLMIGKKKVVGQSQRRRANAVLHQATVFLDAPGKELAALIVKGFERKWGIHFEERPLSESEMNEAEHLAVLRFADPRRAALIDAGD